MDNKYITKLINILVNFIIDNYNENIFDAMSVEMLENDIDKLYSKIKKFDRTISSYLKELIIKIKGS